MEPQKSQTEFYLGILIELVQSDPLRLNRQRDLRADIRTLRERTASEGLSFLTKTLPKLGKALDVGLATETFSIPSGFKSAHKNRGIPAFLQAYFNVLFGDDGRLLPSASAEAVKHLRQVLFVAYKLELPYSQADESRVLEAFIATDKELELGKSPLVRAMLEHAAGLIERVFKEFNPLDIVPRHGPGAVATGEKLEQKWHFGRLYESIHSVYPYSQYFMAGGDTEMVLRWDWYRALPRLDKGRAKVVLVPKDSRGPRLISAEPLEFQWIQQGLGRKVMSHLEEHPLTRGRINFTSQSINRDLALRNSVTREFATIDLKDASDRVSLELVRELYGKVPTLLQALEATRTAETELPDGRIVTMKKYAPMGSALCFPIEAVCFWAISVTALQLLGVSQSKAEHSVFVYGDDIIIPTDMALGVMQFLELAGLKVNQQKSCIQGPFRESCGMDAFKGVCVTPTRMKTLWTNRRSDGDAYVSYIAFANNLVSSGYKTVADYVWRELTRVYGNIPYGTVDSAYPCKHVQSSIEAMLLNVEQGFKRRWHASSQKVQFLVRRLLPRRQNSELDDWPRLLRNFTMPSTEDPSQVVIPRTTKIYPRWVAVR